MLTAAISSRSSFDKSGAIFTSNGGGPSSPHCISSRAAWTFRIKANFARVNLPSMQQKKLMEKASRSCSKFYLLHKILQLLSSLKHAQTRGIGWWNINYLERDSKNIKQNRIAKICLKICSKLHGSLIKNNLIWNPYRHILPFPGWTSKTT